MFDNLVTEVDGDATAVNASLESLLESAPGPRAVELLAGLDPAELDEVGRVLLLQAWERQARWVAARQLAAMAAVRAPAWLDDRHDEWVSEDVAAALHLAPGTAGRPTPAGGSSATPTPASSGPTRSD